ncbi:serine/threonine protein kinase [Xylophilus sp.]|uniref:serine/threonine protein kinase n=1 Tax=Xylophilus sp. TaxID=2653893 RepID=UPI0013B96152|nr:protein kinase [Xylophilus sp.]KAF1046425.1 MAG: Serine/threonine-protein kinase pkn6 [Xylophilus sp.]
MTPANDPPQPVHVPAVSHIDALPPGSRLAEFEVVGLLGVGGFGMVYHAFDHSLHRAVAIKEYMPAALVGRAAGLSVTLRSSADAQPFEAGLRSFIGEARLLAQFDHPSLVKVFRFWEANGTAYMVMPLYAGTTLKQARAQLRRPPSEQWLRTVLWSALGALRVLHGAQTLHRDVSPDNIFLQDIGPPVLLDLGAARRAIGEGTRHHTAVLKVNYAPVEQYAEAASDLRQGPWTDLYALAAVVHGLVCNEPPPPATFRVLRDRMVPFEQAAATVEAEFGERYSPAFVGAVTRALSIRPEDRPQSIDAFIAAMALLPPAQPLETFDWRAASGDAWADPVDLAVDPAPTGAAVPPPQERTQVLPPRLPGVTLADMPAPATGPMALPAPPPAAEAAAAGSGAAPPPRHRGRIAAIAGLTALLAAAAFAWSLQRTPPQPDIVRTPDDQVITEAPEAVSVPTAASREPAAVAAATAPASPRPARPEPAVWPVAGETAPARRPVERTSAICADASAFGRTMCIHTECQKPANAHNAVCVDYRRKQREERERLSN